MVNRSAAQHAVKLLGGNHASVVLALADEQDKREAKWMARTKGLNKKIRDHIIASLKESGRIKIDEKAIIEFLFEHYIDVADAALESTQREMQVAVGRARMARPKLPRSFREIREMYDRYRRTGRIPRVFRELGKDIKAEYLKKTQSVWQKYSEAFRAGDEFTQADVLRRVADAADTAEARAKTIVRTETTNYYNETRREIYDQSDAVTHYLFLAIRDQRTTKWCSDKVVAGKRGRHGLIYAKEDPITARETPACHWNCRSEMVPLSPFNPRHLRLIKNLEMHRRNHSCHPLPEGWGNVG